MAIELVVQENAIVEFGVETPDVATFVMGDVIAIYPPEYDGEYIVTPKVESQSLFTRGLMMRDDVTVLAVPYHETSNPDGTTVYIASEV